jgi:hypothetical protein
VCQRVPVKFGKIRTHRDFNPNFGCLLFLGVIQREPFPDLGCFDSNNRVFPRYIRGSAMKQVYSNRSLLQVLGATLDGTFDHIDEEFLRARTVAECTAVLDPR